MLEEKGNALAKQKLADFHVVITNDYSLNVNGNWTNDAYTYDDKGLISKIVTKLVKTTSDTTYTYDIKIFYRPGNPNNENVDV